MEHALGNIVSMYTIMLAAFAFRKVIPFSVETVNNLVLYFFLPVTVVYSIAKMASLDAVWFLIIFSICFVLITSTYFIGWFAGGMLKLTMAGRRTFGLSTAFGNYGFLGLPVTYAVLGQEGLVYAVYFLIGSYLFLYTAGFFIMTGRVSLVPMLMNPLLIATAVGMLLLAFQVEFHPWLDQTIRMVSDATFPLSMVVVGGSLSLRFLTALKGFGVPAAAALLKLCAPPGLAYLLCAALSVPPLQTAACILQATMPTGVLVTVFSIKYGGDEALSNAVVTLSILGGLVTVPFWAAMLLNVS